MSTTAVEPPSMTAVFVPTAVVRRPTFEQVLRPWIEGSHQLFLPKKQDEIVSLPTFLMDDFLISTKDQTESEKARRALFQGETESLDHFAPAATAKLSTESAMKSFIADLMVKRHHSVRFWKNGEKTFEDDFVEILSSGKIVDITDVAAEINTCWMDYKNRSETMKRTRGLMHSFCATLNEHKEVFNLIPSDNIYTSSLCAALKLLVNASISYEAMAEGFARAMVEISFELANVQSFQALFNTEEMKAIVVPLYTHVMKFLCLSMRWCKKYGSTGRFFSSFASGGYWSKVEPEVETIKTLAQRVKDVASKNAMVESRNANIRAQNQSHNDRLRMWCFTQLVLTDNRRSRDEMGEKIDKLEDKLDSLATARYANRRSIDQGSKSGVRDEMSAAHSPIINLKSTMPPKAIHDLEASRSGRSEPAIKLNIEELLEAARTHFSATIANISPTQDLGVIRLWRSNLAKFKLPPQASTKIQNWLLSSTADMLWIRGSNRSRGSVNPLSKLSANLISAAQLAGLPTLYFFCGLNLGVGEERNKSPTSAILMVLVAQALEWLKNFDGDSHTSDKSISVERFKAASKSEKKLWELFVDVIGLLPKLPLILIDLLEVYDEDEYELEQLIQRLVSLVPRDEFSEDEDEDRDADADDSDQDGKGAVATPKLAKILVTSKRVSLLLEEQIPQRFKLEVNSMKKGKGRRGFSVREWEEATSSDDEMCSVSEASSLSEED